MTETAPAAGESKSASSNWRKTAIQAAISLFVVAVIVSRIEVDRVGALLGRTRPEWLVASALLTVAQLAVSAWGVGVLLSHEQRVPFRRLFFYYSFSWTLGHVSFGRVGEFSISYYLKKEGIPYSKSLAIVLLDKVVTLVVFLAVAALGTVWFFGFGNWVLLLFNAGVLGALVALLWVLGADRLPAAGVLARFPRVEALLARRRDNFATFRATFSVYFKERLPALAENVLATALRLFLMAVNGTVLFWAIDSHINPFYMMFIITITAMVALVPISLSGFGVVAASYIYLASLVNISAEAALATELLSIAVSYAVALVVAAASLRQRPK